MQSVFLKDRNREEGNTIKSKKIRERREDRRKKM